MEKKELYERIAKKYHTTPEEVYIEMEKAIHAAFANTDPEVQREWQKVKISGDRPTPEEVIDYAVQKLGGH